jgi:hypothetical protein
MDYYAHSVVNQTFAANNNSYVSVGTNIDRIFGVSCTNQSDVTISLNETAPGTDGFTVDSESGTIYVHQDLFNGDNINCSYSHYSDDEKFNATQNGLLSLETSSSWIPTLAIVVIAAVVIGVISVYFMRAV